MHMLCIRWRPITVAGSHEDLLRLDLPRLLIVEAVLVEDPLHDLRDAFHRRGICRRRVRRHLHGGSMLEDRSWRI